MVGVLGAGPPPALPDLVARPLQHRLVGGVLPQHQVFDDAEQPLALLLLRLLGREQVRDAPTDRPPSARRSPPAPPPAAAAPTKCSVLGLPADDFSRAEALLIASSGSATSISFFFTKVLFLESRLNCISRFAVEESPRQFTALSGVERAFSIRASRSNSALHRSLIPRARRSRHRASSATFIASIRSSSPTFRPLKKKRSVKAFRGNVAISTSSDRDWPHGEMRFRCVPRKLTVEIRKRGHEIRAQGSCQAVDQVLDDALDDILSDLAGRPSSRCMALRSATKASRFP